MLSAGSSMRTRDSGQMSDYMICEAVRYKVNVKRSESKLEVSRGREKWRR